MPADRAGRLLVGPNPERIASRDGQEVGVLLEERFDQLVRPSHASLAGSPCPGDGPPSIAPEQPEQQRLLGVQPVLGLVPHH